MMHRSLHLCASVLALSAVSGCGPEVRDFIAPEIAVAKPGDQQQFLSGDTLAFDARFSDNTGLLSYSLVIRNNFEDHYQKVAHPIGPFSYSENPPISGQEQDVYRKIPIDTHVAAGEYLVQARATDAVGNEAIMQQVTIIVKNALDLIDPSVSVTSLQDTVPNNYLKNAEINLAGTIDDNKELGNLEVLLLDGNDVVLFENDIHLASTPFALNETVTAPSWPGHFYLHLICHDKVNNITKSVFEVIVH